MFKIDTPWSKRGAASLTPKGLKAALPEHIREKNQRRRRIFSLVPEGGVVAEIGVFRGWFSAEICQHARPKKLYLVDPWTKMGETFGWRDTANTDFGQLTTIRAKEEALTRCQAFPDTEVVDIEDFFPACMDQIKEPLDWAYLDAGHSYDSTLSELQALDKIVKPDGFIVGDDWSTKTTSKHFGVVRAVSDFVTQSDWNVILAGVGKQFVLRRF